METFNDSESAEDMEKESSVLSVNLFPSFFKINFYWSIVDLQCCVSFCYTAK